MPPAPRFTTQKFYFIKVSKVIAKRKILLEQFSSSTFINFTNDTLMMYVLIFKLKNLEALIRFKAKFLRIPFSIIFDFQKCREPWLSAYSEFNLINLKKYIIIIVKPMYSLHWFFLSVSLRQGLNFFFNFFNSLLTSLSEF